MDAKELQELNELRQNDGFTDEEYDAAKTLYFLERGIIMEDSK